MINQLIYWVLSTSEIIRARSLAGLAIRRIDITLLAGGSSHLAYPGG